jgi:hypothetical protein
MRKRNHRSSISDVKKSMIEIASLIFIILGTIQLIIIEVKVILSLLGYLKF